MLSLLKYCKLLRSFNNLYTGDWFYIVPYVHNFSTESKYRYEQKDWVIFLLKKYFLKLLSYFFYRKKIPKWYFFNPFGIYTFAKRPRIKILRMPSDVLGRNTPFYFNTSKILARVATDCFKYDVYIKKGNMARKSPAKKSNPFAQTKYFFFIYLFCMYRGSILKLPLGARNIQISNRYMFGTKAAGYCGKINLAISAGTKCANGRLAGK